MTANATFFVLRHRRPLFTISLRMREGKTPCNCTGIGNGARHPIYAYALVKEGPMSYSN